MADLIERYVHQVGLYVPLDERNEIEAELRSQIQDQLDDRYGDAPSELETATVLKELGSPYKMAAPYRTEKYLIGPDIYPCFMTVLRRGWLLVPAFVIFLNVFGALTAPEPIRVSRLLIDPLLAAIQVTLVFSGVVVMFFVMAERAGISMAAINKGFDPFELPDIDDPGIVDQSEAAFTLVFGLFFTLVFVYFLHVGGLTLRFNLSDPGEVIPAPPTWMALLIICGIANIILHMVVMRRGRLSVGILLTQIVLTMFGWICMYFVVLDPLFTRLVLAVPILENLPIPEFLAILFAILTLMSDGFKLIRLWNYNNRSTPPYTVQANIQTHS